MELRVLKYFLTVAREENITKAAEVLHITQPTLSRQLAQLEEEIGVKLFDRGTRKVVLTDEGMLLRRRAEEIIELVDKTEQELIEQEEDLEGVVSIGCGDMKAVEQLADCIRMFHEKYPRVTFEFYTATADHVKERMERGITDIGLLLEPIDMGKYDFIRLEEKEHWMVLMHPDSPLAEKDYVTPEDLAEVPLIMPYRLGVQSELASWFGESYDKLHIIFTSNLPSSSMFMAYEKLGYALVISGVAAFLDKEKLVCRPLKPGLKATCVLAWKRGLPFGAAAEKFSSCLRETFPGGKNEESI